MANLTEDQIAAIQARSAAATELARGPYGQQVIQSSLADIPALIHEIRRLQERLASLYWVLK